MVYGYCRISTGKQNIERQERNIKAVFPDAVIVKEIYTATNRHYRPAFAELIDRVAPGDIIVFDDATRMSRSGTEGSNLYMQLFCRGIELVFLKNPQMDTSVIKNTILSTVLSVFEQAEKEVADLHQRTKEGIETARLHGKQIGGQAGRKLNVKKAIPAKEQIRRYSRDFDGTLNDVECIKLVGLARNTYYKYKREMRLSA